jgi:uncharacterized membrane protein YkvA (DUF1232 family)
MVGKLFRRGKEGQPSVRQEIMALPLRSKIKLPWRLLLDPAVPLGAKALIPLAVVYLALPADLIPDVIPVLGQLDDVLVISLGLALFLRLCPEETLRRQVALLRAERGR